MKRHFNLWKKATTCAAAALFAATMVGCSSEPKAADAEPPLHKIPAGQEFSGFLKNYEVLKPNEVLGGNALTYAARDISITGTEEKRSLRSYFAIVVDPIEVYIATDVDAAKVDQEARKALTAYFHHALVMAVSDAFPVADKPGPLTLRLRAALVGVDVGGAAEAGSALNIGKVGVEMELVDSVTGERIAAMVDRANLGEGAEVGAEVGAENFSRAQKFEAAKDAFDEWAGRVREFLDSAHELTGADAERAVQSYQPYQ